MKITKKQIRRIIKEAIDPHYSMEFGYEIHDSVIGILFGTFMGGRELAARVRNELAASNITENEVFTVLDEMLEDHTVIFDVEEDEWSLV